MNYVEHLEFKLEKLLGFRNMQETLENCFEIVTGKMVLNAFSYSPSSFFGSPYQRAMRTLWRNDRNVSYENSSPIQTRHQSAGKEIQVSILWENFPWWKHFT